MTDAPNGVLFTYYPARARILMTPTGGEPGWEEPFADFLASFHPADAERLRKAFDAALTGRSRKAVDLELGESGISLALSAHVVPGMEGVGPFLSGMLHERSTDSVALDRFIQATNASPNTIFLMDFESGKHFWSDAFQERYGHRPFQGPDVVAQWFDLVHPDDKARIKASHSLARDGGARSWEDEYRLRRADGTYATVIDRAAFYRRADGSIARSISSLEDVTDLRARESELRHANDTAPEVAYVWDLAQDTLTFGPEMASRYGPLPAPLSADGSRRLEMIHPDDRAAVAADLADLAGNGRLQATLHYRIVTASGRAIPVSDQSEILRDADGRMIRMTGKLIDRTEVVVAEQRLWEQGAAEATEQGAIDTLPRGTAMGDDMRETFGLFWLGKIQTSPHWSDSVHPEDRAQVMAALEAFLDGETRFTRLSYRFRRSEGDWYEVIERLTAMRDLDGRVLRLVGEWRLALPKPGIAG